MRRKKKSPQISFDMRVTVPAGVLLQEVEGEIVALNLDTELYLGLNKTGADIFKRMSEATSIEQAYEGLLGTYDVAPEDLRVVLTDFIKKLLDHRLIEVSRP